MPTAIEAQIRTRIAAFVEELDKLARLSTLDALRAALEKRPAPAPRRRPAGARRAPGRSRSVNVEDAAAKIVTHVRANDGQGIAAIAEATGVDLKTAKKAVIELLAAGALKKSGVKRATVYHPGRRKPAKAAKKRATRKVRRERKPATRKAPRKARESRRGVVIPVRKRPAAKRTIVTRTGATKAAVTKSAPVTDVPAALAAG